MTTKAQERKALEKIMEIVDGLGENSYVGTALEGCLEMASENIELDFGNSPKDKWETAQKRAEEAEKEAAEYREAYKAMQTRLEIEQVKTKGAQDKLAYHIATEQAMDKKEQELEEKLNKADEAQKELKAQLEAKELEIMKLKAKLFDLMMAEK